MNTLTIQNGRVYLDDKKIECVTYYRVKSSEKDKITELNLKLIASTVELNEKTAQETQVQEQYLKHIEELKFQKKIIRNLIILQVILTIILFILVLKKYQLTLEINNILIELESLFFGFNH